ncbi:MAG: hypothetical protein ACHRXM_27295 [Isosphaerales bacterium]
MISNLLESAGPGYLDPISDFADAQLAASLKSERIGTSPTGSSLFNGRLADGHFSPAGCELWAAVVGRRLELLIQQRQAVEEAANREAPDNPNVQPRQMPWGDPTPRSP